jgi:hypothetical protein
MDHIGDFVYSAEVSIDRAPPDRLFGVRPSECHVSASIVGKSAPTLAPLETAPRKYDTSACQRTQLTFFASREMLVAGKQLGSPSVDEIGRMFGVAGIIAKMPLRTAVHAFKPAPAV